MTDAQPDDAALPDRRDRPPNEMRSRSPRPPVTRLSRKVLIGLGAIAALGVGGAIVAALQPQHKPVGSELYSTDNRNTPDGLANLPKDYTDLPHGAPRLGPPLPGDLGRPILNAGAPAPTMANPEHERAAQEQEAALTSHLFATTNTGPVIPASFQAPASGSPAGQAKPSGSSDPISQDHKLAFLNGNVDRRTVSPDRIEGPASPYGHCHIYQEEALSPRPTDLLSH